VSEKLPRDIWVTLIGIGKILKTLSLTAIGITALLLVHHDAAEELRHWVGILGLAPGGRLVREALAAAGVLNDHLLREIGVVLFIYAALFAVEGAGLLLRKRWGEWVSIIITGSFVPLELYESARQPHVGRIVGTILNIAAVAYLVHRVRQRREEEKEREKAPRAVEA
jgi:uncharacterized membrane protein (DUF2068 family)